MDAEEAKAFEAHPLFREILRLRAWDEAAKVPEGRGLSIGELRVMAENYKRGR
jgi:predicted HD phosphohydrolase